MSRRLRFLVLASVLASAPAACRQTAGPAPAERTTLRVLDINGAPRRIDHIFLRAVPSLPLRPRSSRVVIDEAIGGQHASDHYGIFTEFEVGR